MHRRIDLEQAILEASTNRRRGRPVSGKAISNAERQRSYRQRKQQTILSLVQSLDGQSTDTLLVRIAELENLCHALTSANDTLNQRIYSERHDFVQERKNTIAAYRGRIAKLRNENSLLKDRLRNLQLTIKG